MVNYVFDNVITDSKLTFLTMGISDKENDNML